jgi:hypothetical protein
VRAEGLGKLEKIHLNGKNHATSREEEEKKKQSKQIRMI